MGLPPELAAIIARDEGLTPTEYAIKRKGQTYLQKIDENTRPIQGVMRTGKEAFHKIMEIGGAAVRGTLGAPYGISGADPTQFAQEMQAKAKEFEGGTDPVDALANRWAGFIPRTITRIGDVGEEVIGRGLRVAGEYGKNVGALAGGASALISGDVEKAKERISAFDPTSGAKALLESPEDNPQIRGLAVGMALDPLTLIPGEKVLSGLSTVRSKLPGALTKAQKLADENRITAARLGRAPSGLESAQAQQEAVQIFNQAKEAGISKDRLEEIVRYYFDPNDRIRIYGKVDPVTGATRLRGKKALARAFENEGGGFLAPYMGPLTPEQSDYMDAVQKATPALRAKGVDLPIMGRLTEEEQVFADSLERWFANRKSAIDLSGKSPNANISSNQAAFAAAQGKPYNMVGDFPEISEARNKLSGKYIHRAYSEKPEVDLVKKLQVLTIRNGIGKQGIQIARTGDVPLGSNRAEKLGGSFDPADIVDAYDWQANRVSTLQRATQYLRSQSATGKLNPKDLAWLRDRYGSSKFQDQMAVMFRETGNEKSDILLKKMKSGFGQATQAYAWFLDKMNANVLQHNPAHHVSNYISDSNLVWQAGYNPVHIADEGTDLLKMGQSSKIFQEAIADGLDVVNAGRSELLRQSGRLAEKLRYSGGYGPSTEEAINKVLSRIHDKTGIALPLQREVSENWDAALKLGMYKVLKYEKGLSGQQAVAEVFRILPEYGNDTHLFRAIKSIIPFLTWQVQMVKKVPRNMILNPGRTALQARVQEAAAPQEEGPLTWREHHSFVTMPDEMKQIYDMLARSIGANPKAGELIMRAYMPSEALAPVFSAGETALASSRAGLNITSQAAAFKNIALQTLNRTNPVIRGIGESLVGLDAFDQRPLDSIGPIPNLITNTASEVIPSLIPITPLASAGINYLGKEITGYDRIVGGIRKDLRADPANQLTDALISTMTGARVKTTDRQRRAQNAQILRRRHFPEKSR
jgi:hypothetical protein